MSVGLGADIGLMRALLLNVHREHYLTCLPHHELDLYRHSNLELTAYATPWHYRTDIYLLACGYVLVIQWHTYLVYLCADLQFNYGNNDPRRMGHVTDSRLLAP